MPTELKIPNIGESITEVQIAEWLKAEGDTVKKGENVAVINSEKATLDLPSSRSGRLAKILHQAGETVKIGEVIAEIETAPTEGKTEATAAKAETEANPKAKPEGSKKDRRSRKRKARRRRKRRARAGSRFNRTSGKRRESKKPKPQTRKLPPSQSPAGSVRRSRRRGRPDDDAAPDDGKTAGGSQATDGHVDHLQ